MQRNCFIRNDIGDFGNILSSLFNIDVLKTVSSRGEYNKTDSLDGFKRIGFKSVYFIKIVCKHIF